jgi:U3 small nucleolar RNA-associated protein 3
MKTPRPSGRVEKLHLPVMTSSKTLKMNVQRLALTHSDLLVFEQRDEIMLEGSKWGRKKDHDYMSASDEEILPLGNVSESEEEDDDEEGDDEEVSDGQDDDRSMVDEGEDEELDREGWGSSRKAYYGADEASEDEDIALEEQEAEKLQKKHLARLRPEDFLDTWADATTSAGSTKHSTKVVSEALPAPDLSKLSTAEVSKLLKSRHPEVAHFASLYRELYPEVSSLALLAARPYHPQHDTIKLKFALLSVLLSSIALYFAIRADPRDRLSTLKKVTAKILDMEALWNQVASVDVDEDAVDVRSLVRTEQKLSALIDGPPLPPKPTSQPRKRKRRAKTLADVTDSSSEDDDLPTLLKKSRPTKSKTLAQEEDDLSDFGDVTSLHPVDAQDKRQNKRTLRFYASQIETKAANRRNKYSGDVEVFKEREKEKDKRQVEEARKRGQQLEPTADLDDEESAPAPAKAVEEDDYYDFIAARATKKKASKKEDYEASKAAARAYLLGDDVQVDEGGKRLITRQIEKNKGLMPKRSKDVRNPRVKKRKKYEKKKIALKGRQAVYVANDPRRGAYGGEASGISKNVVKGVKLS